MAIWYEIEKNEKSIEDFLDCNWGFHDFREQSIRYVPGMDMVEIFLQYDTRKEGVLLRFAWIHDLHINTQKDYDADWIYNSMLKIVDKTLFLWMDEEDDDIDEMKKFATWVEAERIFWAVTDGDGNPVEMPLDRIEQIREDSITKKKMKKHFEMAEFHGAWETILRPYYER